VIFVAVGAQLPFERLIKSVDAWAGTRGRKDIFAQIGETEYKPVNFPWQRFTNPDEFRERVHLADVVVAHAGMGTIITALELGKPVIVMPRRGALREHRNDHQIATARQLSSQGLVSVAWNEDELVEALDREMAHLQAPQRISAEASTDLRDALAEFMERPRVGRVDGVICFGGVDWWYHNRGHYDIQMMREFSRQMPVLYVNSIGTRTPKLGEGRVFVKRAVRKLKSWSRGFQLVRTNFGVLSPVSIPKFHGTGLARRILLEQVEDAAAWMGIKRPLVWAAVPTAAEVTDRLTKAALVYQRTDRFEHYPGVDPDRIRRYDTALKEDAELTVFCSTSVFEDEKAHCRHAAFIDHGVDYERFAQAGDHQAEGPEDLRAIPGPRIGFVGGVDAHTFDPDLFVEVASRMPDCSFVLVGGCSLPDGWCDLENVHLLGRKPYEEVADYMAACDVLIMPWNKSPWIKACNPVKLKEYLAVGRPVVSTPFDELSRYEGHVTVADDAAGFAQKIREALDNPGSKERLRRRVESETWNVKAKKVLDELRSVGVRFGSGFRLQEAEQRHGVHASSAAESNGQALTAPTAPAPERLDGLLPIKPSSLEPAQWKYWRRGHLVAAGLLAMLGVWVTWDAWSDIFRLAWKDEESSHIWLVLPVAAWLAWARKDDALFARRTGKLIGPMMIAVGWLLYSVGDLQLVQSFWHLGAIMIATGCALSVLGSNVLTRLWPAFAVLLFLIPVPGLIRQQIALPMQTITAKITAFMLETLGTDIALSGNVLVINETTVGVAEACNGIRMVFALVLVCYLYAFSTPLSARSRFFILLTSPIIAIAANVFRLIPTVWLYGYSDEATADMFHSMSGWAMIPIALGCLLGADAVIRWSLAEVEKPDRAVTEPIPTRA